MDARTNIKARLPSRHVTEGPERAPHRSYYYAMGMTLAQIALDQRPREIVTRKALENTAVVVAASGDSINEMLPCICVQLLTNAGSGSTCSTSRKSSILKKTPYIADLKPGGRYVAKDMFEAGSIPLLMETLLDQGCTVTV